MPYLLVVIDDEDRFVRVVAHNFQPEGVRRRCLGPSCPLVKKRIEESGLG